MSVFSRNITIDIDELTEDCLAVRTHMVDESHDLHLDLTVSLPSFTIADTRIDMVRIPQPACREIYSSVEKLIGLRIGRGFNRSVAGLLAGPRGCPNIMNLVLVGAPLAINGSHIARFKRQGLTMDDSHKLHLDDYLKGICIAHPAD